MSENQLLKYWPIITFIVSGAVGFGVLQNQVNATGRDVADAKVKANEAFTLAKRIESRVDVHDVKLEYQAVQNTQILSSVKELTQSTNDLKVVIEGLKNQRRIEGESR
ncbi:holin or antiholin [Klebsiella phage vB_KpnS-Carvaje]|uniref:Holin or antiholin n=1 Tax=Klebsiella phage vB_KpnS-Carvaje TaxID=2900314 RepID=A0AAE8ZAP9_9CAUD|nr:holin [Klebsiella phage vB_KpnS-Carvaje]UJQ44021.1 holin or antiholin [Klebsiella phage vB_KpnS-Carvaje]